MRGRSRDCRNQTEPTRIRPAAGSPYGTNAGVTRTAARTAFTAFLLTDSPQLMTLAGRYG